MPPSHGARPTTRAAIDPQSTRSARRSRSVRRPRETRAEVFDGACWVASSARQGEQSPPSNFDSRPRRAGFTRNTPIFEVAFGESSPVFGDDDRFPEWRTRARLFALGRARVPLLQALH